MHINFDPDHRYQCINGKFTLFVSNLGVYIFNSKSFMEGGGNIIRRKRKNKNNLLGKRKKRRMGENSDLLKQF